ncbi:hypothetical protein FKP32DRAFT_1537310, partial [Trametes sanguinea]
DEPLKAWMPYRDEYLDEVLRLEGRCITGDRADCAMCAGGVADLRCQECLGGLLLCKPCMLNAHRRLPFHRVQVRHSANDGRCISAASTPMPLTVIHINGIHTVHVEFCDCIPVPRRQLLLRLRLWPATAADPKTCATFQLLRTFHLLNLQGKATAYDFYRSLELATDNTGLAKLPDRSESFMNMVRQWRHITMTKRGGRGHDQAGIQGTKPGELAVGCRACPEVGVNLPPGWESAGPEDAWLYQLMISHDANFRLKNRLRHSSHQDPWLAPGWVYFVANEPYARFIADKAATEQELRTCSGFAALLNAMTRNSRGLRSTGVVAVSCRHELFRPTGMGDLQKGERYRNIDYVVAAAVAGSKVRMIKNSFDVACEWSKGFFTRVQDLPEELRRAFPDAEWVWVVPKFHVAAHKETCQGTYSPNYVKHVGRWDGEGVERNWAKLNAGAASTKEMGPGARWETLDDFCGFANWRKTVQLGDDLLRLLLEAIPASAQHQADFKAFDLRLRAQRPQDVAEWEAMLEAWEKDHKKANPYLLPQRAITRAEVRLRHLEKENRVGAHTSGEANEVGPSSFVVLGLEIIQAQRAAKQQSAGALTTLQQVELKKKLGPLVGKITRFVELQAAHMPGLASLPPSLLPEPPALTIETATSYPIILPSALPPQIRARVCASELTGIEDDLRYADANEALDDLRHALRMRSAYNHDKVKNVTGQVPNTRARERQSSVEEAVRDAAQRYREARQALEGLRGPGDWEKTLKPLLDGDIVSLNERALSREEIAENERIRALGGTASDDSVPLSGAVYVGEGRRTLSWIWYTGTANLSDNADDPGLRDALRVEWAKAKARAARWTEQVRLVEEEMRRVIESTRYRARRWNLLRSQRQNQPSTRPAPDALLDEGLKAYADEQAALETALADTFERRWKVIREKAK